MKSKPPMVGAQDPELKNSPIAWEGDEETETLRATIPDEPTCFFNDDEYAHGRIVVCENVRLRCERGIWVPADPSNST